MSVLNLHDAGCDGALHEDRCTCAPVKSAPWPVEPPGKPPVVATEESVHLTDVEVEMLVGVQNPLPVFTAEGKQIGAAVVEFAAGGIRARLFLDRNTPEVFDLETDPRRCAFDFDCELRGSTLAGKIRFKSK